jgi:hypothetical protein
MPINKGEDYKLSAVQYFLENDVTYSATCKRKLTRGISTLHRKPKTYKKN